MTLTFSDGEGTFSITKQKARNQNEGNNGAKSSTHYAPHSNAGAHEGRHRPLVFVTFVFGP